MSDFSTLNPQHSTKRNVADAQWPRSNPANAGIRTEFKLPSDRALK